MELNKTYNSTMVNGLPAQAMMMGMMMRFIKRGGTA